MTNNDITANYELKRIIKDIRRWDQDWRHVEKFQILVVRLNEASMRLNLPTFTFEKYHFSSTGKTVNDIGYNSLINHIEILEEFIKTGLGSSSSKIKKQNNKVFIVHGRDREALLETENILIRAGLEPIVLGRMTNQGLTLIEKFEKYSDVSYAVVLLTPDDVGALYDENTAFSSLDPRFRARQNVLFELGFFYGKLGRSNVSCILKSNVEKPTDIDGIVYLPYKNSVEELEMLILREFNDAGLIFDIFK